MPHLIRRLGAGHPSTFASLVRLDHIEGVPPPEVVHIKRQSYLKKYVPGGNGAISQPVEEICDTNPFIHFVNDGIGKLPRNALLIGKIDVQSLPAGNRF
jgi:hypothetical protein